jgi:hypothetical protein
MIENFISTENIGRLKRIAVDKGEIENTEMLALLSTKSRRRMGKEYIAPVPLTKQPT